MLLLSAVEATCHPETVSLLQRTSKDAHHLMAHECPGGAMSIQTTKDRECRCSRSLAYGTDAVSMFITWFSFVEVATLLKDREPRS